MQALAVDISLAALLGENIYNFGELLQHPIVSKPVCHSLRSVTQTYNAYTGMFTTEWALNHVCMPQLAPPKHTQVP